VLLCFWDGWIKKYVLDLVVVLSFFFGFLQGLREWYEWIVCSWL